MSHGEAGGLEKAEKGFPYDALVVLGAVMEWSPEQKRWEFPTIIDRYRGKLVMGKARALAASELEGDAARTLVTGGTDVHPETGEVASRATELAKLMTERYKMSKEKVIPIGTADAGSVAGNVENVVTYLKEHPEMMRRHRIAILSPHFQKERAQLMFDANPYFKENGIKLDWVIVEDILEGRDPRYKQWTAAVYNTPEAEINRNMEQGGIQDLREGRYGKKKETEE
ncbi:hypothetical protein A3D71_00535 [Candidatus Kaiserbacteria bacterium RIFCSPHIGHO2_02_FULL_55_20]|uniref:DUF218 domain-containing protein n=1 Tax=Candidatus Kaiserbacteria bacterium RIFCSPHIGHO2_02_FULL_55_20 TaxID=1798497 RepID=A0A1F6DZW4_9BACT|nr:MAG: hypothetical protein A2680_01550 [Candidatus Kaiserbacteria bacterium RIFCSPHIGHO2_01_FULL_55_37]OGG66522.1 MAG: hypothetical protein A3D71_00535 [Candidatus Kaiserbacteria bacterium RIFCSPHIGHO2_02_FULL_55_20]